MANPGIVSQLYQAREQAGLSPPDDDWVNCLTGGNQYERYFWRRLTRSYIDTTNQITKLTRESDELKDLIQRVELAETLLANGTDPETVARHLDLRPDQIADIQADEPVQWKIPDAQPRARCVKVTH